MPPPPPSTRLLAFIDQGEGGSGGRARANGADGQAWRAGGDGAAAAREQQSRQHTLRSVAGPVDGGRGEHHGEHRVFRGCSAALQQACRPAREGEAGRAGGLAGTREAPEAPTGSEGSLQGAQPSSPAASPQICFSTHTARTVSHPLLLSPSRCQPSPRSPPAPRLLAPCTPAQAIFTVPPLTSALLLARRPSLALALASGAPLSLPTWPGCGSLPST